MQENQQEHLELDSPKSIQDYVIRIWYDFKSFKEQYDKDQHERHSQAEKITKLEKDVHMLLSKKSWQEEAMKVVRWLGWIIAGLGGALVVFQNFLA